MKKIESARIVEKRNGNCEGIRCFGCFNEKWCDNKKSYRAEVYQLDKFKLAQAYIKRHEGKSKKRIIPTKYTADIQPDKTNAECKRVVTLPTVTRPNFRKYLRDKVSFYVIVDKELSAELQKIANEERVGWQCEEFAIITIAKALIFETENGNYFRFHSNIEERESDRYDPSTDTLIEEKAEEHKPVDNPTPLEIAKDIRDNGYSCYLHYECKQCPASTKKTGQINCITNRKQLIDDYIAKNDHIEDKLEMVEPKPISLPDVVYSASKFGVSFVNTKDKTFTTNEKGELFINNEPCFTIPEEALAVALKRWQK